jgi:DNA-binding GntR family transcriptional regulator
MHSKWWLSKMETVETPGIGGYAGSSRAVGRPAGTLHAGLLAALRDHVTEGHLTDGARIPERELCERFGVSRTPLREALKVLAAEGVVELLPNRGARIRALGPDAVRELFEIVGGLEALAGRLACERLTDDAFAEIERLHHDMYRAYLVRDMSGYFRGNQAIHEAIVAAAGNAQLADLHAMMSGRIRRHRYAANLTTDRDRWGEAMREHEAILDALRRRDGDALAPLLVEHLRNKQAAAASSSATTV